jgi:PAS domain S-box-containing protein
MKHWSDPFSAKHDLERLFELSHDLLAVADLEGRFIRLNPAWERVLGHPAGEMLGRPILEWVHPDDRGATRDLTAATAGLGEGRETDEGAFVNRYRRADGSYRWLSWTWTADAEARLIYAVARDVTEERGRQAELERTLRQLQDSNAQLESFASVASHDMREPLRMITNYLKLFRERFPGDIDEKAERYINYSLEGAERLRRMIEDLLSYAGIGSSPVRRDLVDLGEVARGVLAQLEVSVRERGAEVAIEGEWPVVRGDALRLSRLLQNLLSNALKFSSARRAPEVRLSYRRGEGEDEGRMGWLTVSDNGIGIEPEYEPYLFTLFHRLHTADEYEGSGIGLAVCKKIAEQHGGRIWFESKPGRGTTFFVALPVLPAGGGETVARQKD